MRLADLEPRFPRYVRNESGIVHRTVHSLAEAQGVMFLCPACFRVNGGRIGTHQVICWSESRGVPADAQPGPGRWALGGTGLHDLTLTGDNGRSNSVAVGCWHGFVTNGEVTTC